MMSNMTLKKMIGIMRSKESEEEEDDYMDEDDLEAVFLGVDTYS